MQSENKIDLSGAFSRAWLDIKDKIPAEATHLMIHHSGLKASVFYRLSDEMFLGEGGENMAIFGEDPNKRQSRIFLTHKGVQTFMKAQCGEDAVFFDHDIEVGLIVMPDNMTADLIANGSGVRPFRN